MMEKSALTLLCVPAVIFAARCARSVQLQEVTIMNNIVNNTTTANVINTSDIATNRNIVLCGVGGQGTVLASKLLAAAAMSKDIPVMSAETIGMAQRGGSVFSHLRMGKNL